LAPKSIISSRGRDQRCSHPLDRSACEFGNHVAGNTRDERADEENEPAGRKHPPRAKMIRETAAEQEQPPEGDNIGVEDPREIVLGKAEVGLHSWQRDTDDRGVHDHDELRGRDESERPPSFGVVAMFAFGRHAILH
jgi:hypothetical protein